MENTSTSQGNNVEELRVRKSYRAPQLISLGEIQAIIQCGACHPGMDAGPFTTNAVS
jgi:hypothetical protein